jgi:hypothetical protein
MVDRNEIFRGKIHTICGLRYKDIRVLFLNSTDLRG